jgi:hypothetical protein
MKTNISLKSLIIVAALGVALSCVPAYTAHGKATVGGATENPQLRTLEQTNDVVSEWNQQALSLVLLPSSALTSVPQVRVMTIVHVAVHDAVNGITGKYDTYLSPGDAPSNASPEAAAIAAAHQTLRTLFQSQTASLDALFTQSLAAHGLSENDPGIAYGRSAATAILTLRANDHSAEAQFDYDAPGAGTPGVWVRLNNAPAQLPGWGRVTPFVLRSGSQFRPDPPPALGSKQYAKDYNEIKAIGEQNSSTRTNEQTQIALFWRASPAAIWNPVLTQVIATRSLSLSQTARIFALFYLASADASIACWDAKYTYNNWRPILAIRGGDSDGNESTPGDAAWSPFIATPPHPEYPSGHATNSAAMAMILESMFEDNPGVPLVVTQTGITRQWHTFSEGVDEVIGARVYSGIHFRTADEVGARLGRKVAKFVLNHALQRCKHGC